MDVKAEHFERQVQRAEQERDEWEKKHSVGEVTSKFGQCSEANRTSPSGSRREVPAVQEGSRRGRRSNGELGEFLSGDLSDSTNSSFSKVLSRQQLSP